MKFEKLYQDPESDSEAPYADALVLDAGGMNVMHCGEDIAYISFEGLDPLEIAFHAIPEDWEPHEGLDGTKLGLTTEEMLENATVKALSLLGKEKGWKRQ